MDQARHDRIYRSVQLGGIVSAQHVIMLSDNKVVLVDIEVDGPLKATPVKHEVLLEVKHQNP